MPTTPHPSSPRSVVRPAIGRRLRVVLYVLFGLFAVLGINAVYLLGVRLMEWGTGRIYQNFFYLQMFLLHLVLGLLLVLPTLVFAGFHIRNTYRRRNRRAVKAGFALFAAVLVLLVSGLVLTRIEGIIEVNHPVGRQIAFWSHLLAPLFVAWLYVLHRLAGRKIRWRVGMAWAGAAFVCACLLLLLQSQDPREWNVVGNEKGVQYFYPSLARTSTGDFIAAQVLNNDQYCLECHTEAHKSWAASAHHFSSFSNPVYSFSVKNTRHQMMERHGSVQGARFCAGCHDPVPFFSGAFDDPKFDDPRYDLASDAQAGAGITCTVCHSISHINTPRGNADYTIDEPIHYPFAFSANRTLRWVNRQLVKAKPRFHQQTFLKPLHHSTEFCGTCHKVHLPEELNDYRWLRAQNHYDSFLLSGVSGHSVSSFYYPEIADENCNRCHMPQLAVDSSRETPNFGAKLRDPDIGLSTFDHLFPGANTAIPILTKSLMPDWERAIEAHRQLLEGSLRVDIFGVREDGRIDGKLRSRADGRVPVLQPGKTYLFEIVLRTLTLGHHFTQGTSDSNEVWVDVTAKADNSDQWIGRSGGRRKSDNSVDPWSYFMNSFIIDRDGNRIEKRNVEDVFVSLYNHQLPPGAADVVHYRLTVPADATGSVTLSAAIQYRKFDTRLMQFVVGDDSYRNELPIVTICKDEFRFPIGTPTDPTEQSTETQDSIPAWQRWNDYGIGLLRSGQLRQAEEAFQRVEQLGRYDGPLHLARVYLQEGRVTDEAPEALRRAREASAPEWQILWFSALVNKQVGQIDAALHNLMQIYEGGFANTTGRRFDFSKDYRFLNELADTAYLKALRLRGPQQADQRQSNLETALKFYQLALDLDPENSDGHYGISRVYTALGQTPEQEYHARLHEKYKLNDNAKDAAIAAARTKYPAANRAAERVVVYDLQRDSAYELSPTATSDSK